MENSQRVNELADTFKNGIMLVPSIGIPYLFGLTAYKVGIVLYEAASNGIQSISLTPQRKVAPKAPPIEHKVTIHASTEKKS
ncbi:hypothetical protein Ctha_2305 [Chloroherpeton thalassium ATCC 35110]|uniref:Uncharacterized protein n=1 Tax=Chloroherpeton thalassium (strain ATCC 35110 / GB-78) TaxID=517418 RepID=B3QWJ6_CHLT3|nr:hypothetical protein [Chloroherpeton thalassium]ACF14756.1 hypothetical protein Ctha_2305 [Chloroherpeton thalassium ATCC 35110]